tara:strand:+ start:8033 stop:9340 length:1308 start_codon:yes stop_codon:yes gene_type:complete
MNITNLESIFDTLYPINRSILGRGYRKSLEIVKKYVPFEIIEFNSGEKVFDWVIPDEWVINDGYILDNRNKKIIDFNLNNLHVLNYSLPINKKINLKELKKHLYTQCELNDAIPYVTSYYSRNWGFCLTYNQYKTLKRCNYTVFIDSYFIKGKLQVGECFLKGKSNKEILISTYLCHPSMANNELSGPLVLIYLYNKIKKMKSRKFSYRFLINPETIGSIAYLSKKNKEIKKNIIGGFVLTCLGGPSRKLSYKVSKNSNSLIDNLFLNDSSIRIREFTPFGGSDERQYNSPGINLPIGQIARTIYEEYPEYHTSLDNKEFMSMNQVFKSCKEIFSIIKKFESEKFYFNNFPNCEPQLGKRNLYPNINSKFNRENTSADDLDDGRIFNKIVMILLNYSDGYHSIQHISRKFNLDIKLLEKVTKELLNKNLVKEIYN